MHHDALTWLLLSVPLESWDKCLPPSQCPLDWGPGSTEQPSLETWASSGPSLSTPAEGSRLRLSALSLRCWGLAVAIPLAADSQHAESSWLLSQHHPICSRRVSPGGWEELASSQPYNLCLFLLPLSWENKEWLGWKGTPLSPGKGQGKVPFSIPFLDQLILGCHPWGMILTSLSLNFLIYVKDRESHQRKPCY